MDDAVRLAIADQTLAALTYTGDGEQRRVVGRITWNQPILGDAAEVVRLDRLGPAPDCGMWFLPRDTALAEITAMETAARDLRAGR